MLSESWLAGEWRREVWTKEQKGETMVRKLVVAEIRHDPESFPFAVYWVDFSPKRKEPLKVDVSFATTAERAIGGGMATNRC